MKWIIGVIVAAILGVGGFFGYNAIYSDNYSYTDEPGVYQNDGHGSDHGYFGAY